MHTGEVYLNGKAMYEEDALEKILHPQVRENSWDPEASVYQWYTCQEEEHTLIYANFREQIPIKSRWRSTSEGTASIRPGRE